MQLMVSAIEAKSSVLSAVVSNSLLGSGSTSRFYDIARNFVLAPRCAANGAFIQHCAIIFWRGVG